MYDFSVIRTLRNHEKMTLDEASRLSGVSVSVISKLERNQNSAEIETLYKLARIFGLRASELLSMAESGIAQRCNESTYGSGDFSFRRIRYNNHTCFVGFAKKGAKVSRPEIHSDDFEMCWVQKGAVEINLPQQKLTVKKGEAIQFDAIQEHTYNALSDVEFIIVHIRKEKRL